MDSPLLPPPEPGAGGEEKEGKGNSTEIPAAPETPPRVGPSDSVRSISKNITDYGSRALYVDGRALARERDRERKRARARAEGVLVLSLRSHVRFLCVGRKRRRNSQTSHSVSTLDLIADTVNLSLSPPCLPPSPPSLPP